MVKTSGAIAKILARIESAERHRRIGLVRRVIAKTLKGTPNANIARISPRTVVAMDDAGIGFNAETITAEFKRQLALDAEAQARVKARAPLGLEVRKHLKDLLPDLSAKTKGTVAALIAFEMEKRDIAITKESVMAMVAEFRQTRPKLFAGVDLYVPTFGQDGP